jgi:hypothetical protein
VSNAYAIAAVTITLQHILDEGVEDLTANVSILPLDKVKDSSAGQLNLFLYQVSRNAAWSNRDMPRQVQPGETGVPPLPLDLYYLITAFAGDNDPGKSTDHTLLGQAMRVLHDHPVLSADDIKLATQGQVPLLPKSDLDQQIERIRITHHPMPVDEMSKLWTGFATHYRISAAYQVGVALIESARGSRTPLPVLTRGQDDSGIGSQADLTPPFPTLDTLTPPLGQNSVRLKQTITLAGVHLAGDDIVLQFVHPRLADPIERPPDTAGDTAATFTLPNEPLIWPAGFYAVAALVQRSGEPFHRSTNQLAMALAPALTIVSNVISPGAKPDTRDVTITVTAVPDVQLGQRASLLMGEREIVWKPDPAPPHTDTLVFVATEIPVGKYFLRLRVDGVDSLLVDKTTTPPTFDASQQVVVA